MDPFTPSSPFSSLSEGSSTSGLSPIIEVLTTDEATQIMSVEEAGARVEVARLGPYELGECIGKGGMAIVHKAKVVGPFGFEKQVVIKCLQPALMARREFFELFTQEARITAQLGHPGIVQVHDFGVVQGSPFLVMEFLDGVNLAQVVRRLDGGRMPIDVAVIIVTQICHALGYAHGFLDAQGMRRQVIHGDVSPSNIMVCRDGTTKLLDFGVARLLGEFDFELPPMLTGKSAYMSPEQLRREPFDRRVDVFAAGIVLHELLTGRRLFAARNDIETLHRVLAAEVEPPSRANPSVPPLLDEVTLRALAADPGARFESGEEMARALENACRVAGGRRRVAEYLASLFAHPGEGEPSDGTILTTLEPSGMALPEPPPPAPRPVAEPFRPRSITEMVRPLSAPAPPRRKLLLPIALAALSACGGFIIAAGVPWLMQRAPRATVAPHPRRMARHPAFHMLERAEPALPPSPKPITVIEVKPKPIELQPIEVKPIEVKPIEKHAHPRHAKPVEKPAAPKPVPAPAAPPPPAAPKARVKDGRLLDPFNGSFGGP